MGSGLPKITHRYEITNFILLLLILLASLISLSAASWSMTNNPQWTDELGFADGVTGVVLAILGLINLWYWDEGTSTDGWPAWKKTLRLLGTGRRWKFFGFCGTVLFITSHIANWLHDLNKKENLVIGISNFLNYVATLLLFFWIEWKRELERKNNKSLTRCEPIALTG